MEYIKNGKGSTTRCCGCVIRNPIPPLDFRIQNPKKNKTEPTK